MIGMRYGKNTVAVEAVIAEVASWTAAEFGIAGEAYREVRDEALGAALGAALSAADGAERYAAWGEARKAARQAAWKAAGQPPGGTVWDSAHDAVLSAFASDLISVEHKKVLNVGIDAVREHRRKK